MIELVNKIVTLEKMCLHLEAENEMLKERLNVNKEELENEEDIGKNHAKDELEEANTLLSSKLSGFNRANP